METYKIEKKSKILLFVFFVLLIVSIYMTYKRTIVDRDFDVIENTELPE